MMAKIIMYPDGQYGLKTEEFVYRGTKEEVRDAAALIGIPFGEFHSGIFDLELGGLNVSHFGIFGNFLYSEKML